MSTVYIIDISTNSCNYELWLNDVRIDIKLLNRSLSYDLPVNQWLRPKLNDLKVVLTPLQGKAELSPQAYIKLKINSGTLLNGQVTSKTEVKQIKSPDFEDLKSKNPAINLERYELTNDFTANTDYVNPAIATFPTLHADKEDLVEVYKQIYYLCEKKDKQGFLKLINFKMKEFSTAYYTSLASEVNRQAGLLDILFDKSLAPLNFEGYQINYFAGKRIAFLENSKGNPPIYYNDNMENRSFYYPFYFSKSESGEWLVVL